MLILLKIRFAYITKSSYCIRFQMYPFIDNISFNIANNKSKTNVNILDLHVQNIKEYCIYY